eukprot:Gregarina_sp_Poly_1__7101@NODE_3887_length_836_cov_81_084525_g2441_i1_p1_GENE_NODE_3887_length_836_cov_81_084525_g2441_i1NODE_3887_length_836_cov_81_084525_g2441_i1_p1_ORF_typecomplete_len111_score16_95DUF1314/PF07013_11/2e03DUF1314/PF07013_11/0_33_NODE_3887_length_836_cov_81_084525_g2441_i1464796
MDKISFKSSLTQRISSFLGSKARERNIPVDGDSLLIKTSVNSALHYVPQDLAVLMFAAAMTEFGNRKLNPRRRLSDPQRAINEFLNTRGLKQEDMIIVKSKNLWQLSFKA